MYNIFYKKCTNLYIIYVEKEYECNKFLSPEFLNEFTLKDGNKKIINDINVQYLHYINNSIINQEIKYLDLLRNILDNGKERSDRTGTGTIALFSCNLRFNIQESIPILTTKFVSWKVVIEELLWFLRGDTNSKNLEEKGVNIWKGNTSREFLDKRGLSHYQEGDIGPMYGWIWRHYGADYKGCNHDYTGEGDDQFMNVIKMLKEDPFSRRIMITTYDNRIKNQGCLLPCHGLSIYFNVDIDKTGQKWLSASMLQRSSDTFLGLPINICSYTVLVYIIAKLVDMKPKELIINTNDTHIYKDHIESVKKQLNRIPLPFPKLELSDNIVNLDIKEWKIEDFNLIGYIYHPAIKAKMSI
jgi:thymidylate synthase